MKSCRCDFRFQGWVLQHNAESTMLFLFQYNWENIFQNECFKSWYNTLFSVTAEFRYMSQCLSDLLEHPLSVDSCLIFSSNPMIYHFLELSP